MKKFYIIAASAICALVLLCGCEKEKETTVPTPPSLETLKLPLPAEATTKANGEVSEAFKFVVNGVLYNWSLIYNSLIDIPVHGFELVINTTPEQIGNNKWKWESSFKDGLKTYAVDLFGTVVGDMVNWELQVSSDGILGFQNYTWITGTSALDGSHGNWMVNVSPTDTQVLVNLDWLCSEGQVQTVKLTYELNRLYAGILANFNGSSITYSRLATDPAYTNSLVSHYNHQGLGFWDVIIEWNDAAGTGRVCSQNNWGNTEWHIWR